MSISLEESLLGAFDKHIEASGYANRSEAIRDLIRDKLVRDQAAQANGEIVAVVMLVYDHHARELAGKLIEKQHHHHDLVVSSLHVHLGHGLNYENVRHVVRLAGVEELNIGHSIVSRAVLVGMERAVREMKDAIRAACV